MVFDKAGNGLAVWISFSGNDLDSFDKKPKNKKLLYSYYSAASSTWSGEQILATAVDNFQLASNGNGFMASWRQNLTIYASSFVANVWSQPVALGGNTLNYNVNNTVIASNGTGYAVVWTQTDPPVGSSSEFHVYANIYNGSSWGGATILDNNISSGVSPVIASNGTGYAVAWSQSVGSTSDIAATIFDGNNWSNQVTVDINSGFATTPKISSNGNQYMIAWFQPALNEGGNSVFASRYDGTNWMAPDLIEQGPQGPSRMNIASNGSGYAVVWTQRDASLYSRATYNLFDGNNWSGSNIVDAGGSDARKTAVSSDGTNYMVTWEQISNSIQKIHYRQFGSALSTIGTAGNTAIDNNNSNLTYSGGDYVIHWNNTADNNTESNVYAYFTNNVSTNYDSLKNGSHYGNSLLPAISRASNGNKMAAWLQLNNGFYQVYANVYNNGNWSTAFAVDPGVTANVPLCRPQIATNNSGFMLVWQINSTLYSKQYDLSGNALSAKQAISGNYFAFCKYNNQPTLVSNGAQYAAAWRGLATGQLKYDLITSVYDGTSWINTQVSNAGNNASAATIASNGTGYAAAWLENDSNFTDNVFASNYDGTQWSSPESLEALNVDASIPSIASNGNGYAVAFRLQGGVNTAGVLWDFYVNRFVNGSWSGVEKIADASGNNVPTSINIASNMTNYAVVWTNGSSPYEINIRQYSAGSWGAAKNISNSNAIKFYPVLSSNGSGYAASWLTLAGNSQYDLKSSIYSSGVWSSVAEIASLPLNPIYYEPTLDVDGSGYILAWIQYDLIDSVLESVNFASLQ